MEKELIAEIADILEVDPEELSLETDFREDRFDFDSLKGYAMIVMIEDLFDTTISVDDFIASKTIGSLLEKARA